MKKSLNDRANTQLTKFKSDKSELSHRPQLDKFKLRKAVLLITSRRIMSSNKANFAFGLTGPASRMKQLVNNEYKSDVTFKVGTTGQLIYAHQNIITIASEVFYSQFNGGFAESSHSCDNPIVIEDIEPEIFLKLMSYIYCEELVLTVQNVLDILYVSQKYLLQVLTKRCEIFLEGAIDQTNALLILDENHRYMFDHIDEKCLAVIRDNPIMFFKLDTFLKLNQRTVEVIAESRTMNCRKEHLQEAIDSWKTANNCKEVEIIPKLEALQCRKLKSFGRGLYSKNINTWVSLTVKKPIKLYGLGFIVGQKVPTDEVMSVEILVKGANVAKVSKTVPLKNDPYNYEVLFERVAVHKDATIHVTHPTSEIELMCMESFSPLQTLGECDLKACSNNFGAGRTNYNCVAYLLYNL